MDAAAEPGMRNDGCMRIVIGAPANGATLKDALKHYLENDARVDEVVDLSKSSRSYAAVSFKAGERIRDGRADRGVLVCGTGIGTAIAASKVPGVRAATAHDLITIRGSIENYDAQILCMGEKVITAPQAIALLDIWLDLEHDPKGQYHKRLGEITEYESSR